MLPLAVARSFSDDNIIRYVLPVSWMTSCFHIMVRYRGSAIVMVTHVRLATPCMSDIVGSKRFD